MKMLSFVKNVEIFCYDNFLKFFIKKESWDKLTIRNDTIFLPENPITIIINFCYYIKSSF
jgi:hypothetical protein